MDAGIPVINIDSECQNSTVYVGFDQFEYGYMAGKIAADWINKNLSDMTRVPCAVLTKPQSLSLIERGKRHYERTDGALQQGRYHRHARLF